MKKLKKFVVRVEKYFLDKPKMFIPTVAVMVFLLLIGVECVRANQYLKSADNYKSSVIVIKVVDISEKLNKASENVPTGIYCDINLTGLLGKFNEAYVDESTADLDPKDLTKSLNEQVKLASPAPAFNSFAQFIPKISEARQVSQDMAISLKTLDQLTSEEERSTYCDRLVNVLSEVYFLPDIITPQGVNALSVGQIENFQVNSRAAQKELLKMKPPKIFAEQHIQLNEFFNQLAIDLREDVNNVDEFSRRVEDRVAELQDILEGLSLNSSDLQYRASQIPIQAARLN